MGMGFAPTWLRQVSPLLHKTTLTTDSSVTRQSSRTELHFKHRVSYSSGWIARQETVSAGTMDLVASPAYQAYVERLF